MASDIEQMQTYLREHRCPVCQGFKGGWQNVIELDQGRIVGFACPSCRHVVFFAAN